MSAMDRGIARGFVVARRRTPALDAVFSPLYEPDPGHPGGLVRLRLRPDYVGERHFTWDKLACGLGWFADRLGKKLPVHTADSLVENMRLVAPPGSSAAAEVIAELEKVVDEDAIVSIPILLKIAEVLDDGHGLNNSQSAS